MMLRKHGSVDVLFRGMPEVFKKKGPDFSGPFLYLQH